MLVDFPEQYRISENAFRIILPGIWSPIEGFPPDQQERMKEVLLHMTTAKRLGRGLYEADVNFNHSIGPFLVKEWPIEDDLDGAPGDASPALLDAFKNDEPYTSYGVCDSPEQVVEKYKALLNHAERKFIVRLSEIRKEHQPERGGWRWHKWGPYIGTHEIQHEYLYDEEGIDAVLAYHIYEVNL